MRSRRAGSCRPHANRRAWSSLRQLSSRGSRQIQLPWVEVNHVVPPSRATPAEPHVAEALQAPAPGTNAKAASGLGMALADDAIDDRKVPALIDAHVYSGAFEHRVDVASGAIHRHPGDGRAIEDGGPRRGRLRLLSAVQGAVRRPAAGQVSAGPGGRRIGVMSVDQDQPDWPREARREVEGGWSAGAAG